MKQQQARKFYYHLRHHVLTSSNLVLAIALLIAFSWAWGSVGVLERNYRLQREISAKEQELRLVDLEVETLKYQSNYYRSDEYKELAVRQRLGLALPGEKVLILPPNSKRATASEEQASETTSRVVQQSNIEQWINFLFGGNARSSADLQS